MDKEEKRIVKDKILTSEKYDFKNQKWHHVMIIYINIVFNISIEVNYMN